MRNQPSSYDRLAFYESMKFTVVHNHRVDINPTGTAIEVDFSATDPDYIVQVAVKAAYTAGLEACRLEIRQQLKMLLGI